MANWRSVAFQPPEAQKLADLAGVETDLREVEDYCLRFLDEQQKEQPDWKLLEIICAAALIRYGRAFGSGIRSAVPPEVMEELGPHLREQHDYFQAARDKWIAHSVNTFEENQVCAWLTPPERGPIGVYGITVRQQRVTSLGHEAIAVLGSLAKEVREGVERASKIEKAKVLAIAQALSQQAFYEQVDNALLPGTKHPKQVRRAK